MKPLRECRLYGFIDTAYLAGRDPVTIARQWCDGGVDLVQLRAKHTPREDVERIAQAILPVLDRAGVGLVINDYPDMAASIGAPLCHLGQEDFFDAGYSHATDLLASLSRNRTSPSGGRLQIGLSTHSPAQAQRALTAGPYYIAVGPVFPTVTKPSAKAVTLEYVRWAAAHLSIPWFAIGGITLDNLDSVLEAGASRICVVSAILNAPDLARACQAFKDRLLSARRDQS